jgi:hypothetical protein
MLANEKKKGMEEREQCAMFSIPPLPPFLSLLSLSYKLEHTRPEYKQSMDIL